MEAAADTTILHGGVTSSCDQSPISGAMVTLEGGTAGRRQYSTSASGGFRFGGLDPGVAYTLTVTRTGYFDYESEPLTFGEAAVDTVAIAMDWRQC